MTRTVTSWIVVCVFTFVASLDAQAASWKKELIRKIEESYIPTRVSLWDGDLKSGATIMALTQAGIPACVTTAASSRCWLSYVKDGKVDMQPPTIDVSRTLKKGEKVFIEKVEVLEDEKDYFDKKSRYDIIRIVFLTVESSQRQDGGTTTTSRYRGGFDYQFPLKYLQTADFAEVKKALNAAVVSETEYQANDAPATIRLGMTIQQAQDVLGRPSKVIDLGAKKIYVYPDMKITFSDGKVSDVQ